MRNGQILMSKLPYRKPDHLERVVPEVTHEVYEVLVRVEVGNSVHLNLLIVVPCLGAPRLRQQHEERVQQIWNYLRAVVRGGRHVRAVVRGGRWGGRWGGRSLGQQHEERAQQIWDHPQA